VKRHVEADQFALYELIWKRTIASQMESAELERTTADISAQGNDGKTYSFRANGSVIKFDGFLRLYNEDLDDGEDEDSRRLPQMANGDSTEPPPRYSEASLTKKLEDLGIGRPSTYVSIMSTLRDRGYVRLEKKRLIPEDKGRVVTAFLESFFMHFVEYDFTASLEEQLDRVSNGEIHWKELLADFWKEFTAALADVKDLRVTQVSMRSTICSPLISSRRRRMAVKRGPARHALMAGCRSSSAGLAPSLAAQTIPSASTPGP
jgi:DNA topoisomerase I